MRGVADLSRDKTETSCGGGRRCECRKMARKCLGKMTLKGHDAWNPGKSD